MTTITVYCKYYQSSYRKPKSSDSPTVSTFQRLIGGQRVRTAASLPTCHLSSSLASTKARFSSHPPVDL